jgi:zinc protease
MTRMPSPRIPSPAVELHRETLSNGLRVMLSPDHSAPVVAVGVHYDVGFRSEPQGRTGFAHLFEHLMFQGSESLEKLAHFRHVQSSGGTFNGSTHPDYTDYFEVVPSAALERALFIEADRMRAPRITADNLRNQVDVVKEEIRLNVLNRPYGGFPWITLPPVLYDTFPNAHNGYGDFSELEAATVEDCAAFFDVYYAPGNAVLTVCGDFPVDAAVELVHRHFDDVPARPVPVRPSFAEPPPDRERRQVHSDPLAPLPALAIGYRLPDPTAGFEGYLAYELLSALLSDGDSSRLEQRLVHTDALVTDIGAHCGLFGSPLDARDPDTLTITAIHPADVDVSRVLEAADEEIARLAADGPDPDELARITARWAATLFRENDRLVSRTMAIGAFELLHGRAELVAELPAMVAGIGPEQIAKAAAELRPDSRAVLIVEPASGSSVPLLEPASGSSVPLLEPASGSSASQEA